MELATISVMCHIAMLEDTDDDGDNTTWLEPVTDEQYATVDELVTTPGECAGPG